MSESTDGQFDFESLRLLKEHAKELEQAHIQRNNQNRNMENDYFMEWDEEKAVRKQLENVKLTRTPRGRTAIQGMKRLLTATDPLFSVPHDINNRVAVAVADKLEKFSKAMWFAAGRINGDPIHYDIVLSSLLYSEIHIAITSTRDLMNYAKGAGNEAMAEKAGRVKDRTPYLFDVWNPSTGFPEFGPLGLQAFYHKTKVTQAFIEDNWGDRGKKALEYREDKINRYSEVTLNDFYDLKDRVVWLDESDRPIMQEAHKLPVIPIVAQITEGSKLFDKPEKRREPVLWTLHRSELLKRQNLILTVLYTMLFGVGANPMFVNYLHDPDNPPEVDMTRPGGTINMRVGERREPMARQVIDPSILQGWDIANNLEMESTIYRQSLGEPLGMNAPYSMVALLSQSGRLPLTVTQRKAGWAIGEAVETALRLAKHDGNKINARSAENEVMLVASGIPDHFEISARLEIELPQDRLNAANTAAVLAQGEEPMVSKAWVLENILNVGQPDDMQKAIWNEEVANIFHQKFIYEQLAQIEQAKQMAMQPQAAGGMPGGQQMPPQPPGEPSPMQEEQAPFPDPIEPIPPMEPMQPGPQRIA